MDRALLPASNSVAPCHRGRDFRPAGGVIQNCDSRYHIIGTNVNTKFTVGVIADLVCRELGGPQCFEAKNDTA
jgi:hypothetical protein